MNRAILYTFYRGIAVAADRVRLLRSLNPSITIHGLFCGSKELSTAVRQRISSVFDSFTVLVDGTPHERWLNSDWLVRIWFREIGHRLPFDFLHLIEDDLLILAPLCETYSAATERTVFLTGLSPLCDVANRWSWGRKRWWQAELATLIEFSERHAASLCCMASLGVGQACPKSFLQGICALDMPMLAHDEVRWPLLAQILGYTLIDTGFSRYWADRNDARFFNCDRKSVSFEDISEQLDQKDGRRAFHPFYSMITPRLRPRALP